MVLAYFIMGLVAIAVMEGVSEMVQLFPAPNAVVEYVKAFVDADLAWVVGVVYWYWFTLLFYENC
jgi:amino acid permease